jgi:hypothetical protein
MSYYKLIATFCVVTVVGYLYDNYNKKIAREQQIDNYDIVRKHLLGEKPLHLEFHKPTIWVHLDYERNSRNWGSFYTRSSNDINFPFIYCALSTIVRNCSTEFNICFLNDDSFKNVLPNWNIDMSKLSGPTKDLIRLMGLTKTLHMYGGMLLPSSMLVTKSLRSLYDTMITKGGMFAGELVNHNHLHDKLATFISHKVMGCMKESPAMREYCEYLERLISRDYTQEYKFTGEVDKKLHQMRSEGKLTVIPGHILGAVDKNMEVVTLERLFSQTPVPFATNMYMLYVDTEDLMRRSQYAWFLRQSRYQLIENNNVISYFL